MYATHRQTIEASQRWLYMATAYQTRAEKLSQKFNKPSEYPNSVFTCYRGYARCMQMYDACWAHVDAMNSAYFRRQEYENAKKEREKRIADFQAKQDCKFVSGIGSLVAFLIGVLFADVWISFIEWLAPLLI